MHSERTGEGLQPLSRMKLSQPNTLLKQLLTSTWCKAVLYT